MGAHKVMGVVSREANYRDNDKVLTLITREKGRVTATCRGCRKMQSKLRTAAAVFCYGEYVLQEWKGHFYVSQCTVRETFYPLRLRPEALYGAVFALSVSEEFANPNEGYERSFSLLLTTLKRLCDGAYRVEGVLTFFLIKAMCFEGYQWQVERCESCGGEDNLRYMDLSVGGVLCGKCGGGRADVFSLSELGLRLLQTVPRVPTAIYSELQDVLEVCAEELLPVLEAYVRGIVNRKLPKRAPDFDLV